MDEHALLQIASGLNAAAAGDADWNTEWSRAVTWLRARTSLLTVWAPGGGSDMLEFPVVSDVAIARYDGYYRKLDPYEGHAGRGVDTPVFLGQQVISEADYLGSEFYCDFIRTLDQPIMHFMGASRMLPDGSQIRLGLHRERGEPSFERAEALRLETLMPILCGAIATRQTVRGLRATIAAREAALDAVDDAILIATPDGAVIPLNDAASRLAHRHGLLVAALGRRSCRLPNTRMARRLAAAVRAMHADPTGAPERLLLDDDRGPAIAARMCRFVDGAILVRLTDLRQGEADAPALRSLFGLTPAEAEIAVLIARGVEMNRIAIARDVSIHTVRTQVRGLLAKTGATDLRDLARLLSRL